MSDPKQSADPAGEEPNEPGNGGVTVIDGIATGRIFTMRGLRTELDPLVEDALANLASDEGEVDAIRAEIRKRGLADEVARLTKSLNRAPLGDAERKLLATRGTYETLVVNALDNTTENATCRCARASVTNKFDLNLCRRFVGNSGNPNINTLAYVAVEGGAAPPSDVNGTIVSAPPATE